MSLLNALAQLTVTDLSATLTNSGDVAAVAFPAGTAHVDFFNPSTGDLWLRWGGAPVVNGSGSFKVLSGGSYRPPAGTWGTLRVLSTAAAQPFTAYAHG